MKIEMTKRDLQILKSLSKFVKKDNSHIANMIYNGTKKRFEVTNGFVVIVLSALENSEGIEDRNYVATIAKDCIFLEETKEPWIRIERVIPTAEVIAADMEKKDSLSCSTRKDFNDKHISTFLAKTDICINLRYLLDLPKTDSSYEFFQYKKDYKGRPILLTNDTTLGKIQVVIMPINMD